MRNEAIKKGGPARYLRVLVMGTKAHPKHICCLGKQGSSYLFYFLIIFYGINIGHRLYRTCLIKHMCRELEKITLNSPITQNIRDTLKIYRLLFQDPNACRELGVSLGDRQLGGLRLWVPISVLGKTNNNNNHKNPDGICINLSWE